MLDTSFRRRSLSQLTDKAVVEEGKSVVLVRKEC
jgi:hypothetical protein